ncbi:MAG: DNA adenine methylase [Leptolyngbyaceae bacterium]|nr:DNA adenine methylase [Leptolyngbyaceae bacterium]
MSIYYSPLRYPGGKNCIFPFMAQLFYENQLIGIDYAEPYAGGAGLALRLLVEGYVNHIYINDLDKSIHALWRAIVYRADELCEWIDEIEVSVDNWKKYRNIQNNFHISDEFELAKSTFFLNRTNISGVISGGIIGGLEQKGKYKIDARFNKKDLISRIQKIKTLKNQISISNFDGLKFLSNLDKSKKETFIYIDPPYYCKGSDLYMNFYTAEHHKKLAAKIHRLHQKWVVSYDTHEYILQLYSQDRKIMYKLSQSVSNRVGDELFVFSEKIDFSESVSKLKSVQLC